MWPEGLCHKKIPTTSGIPACSVLYQLSAPTGVQKKNKPYEKYYSCCSKVEQEVEPTTKHILFSYHLPLGCFLYLEDGSSSSISKVMDLRARLRLRHILRAKYLWLLLFVDLCIIVQGEHKNTSWFQVVIKSKITGIFLQNWWLQLHKLIQFHVVCVKSYLPRCARLVTLG